MSGLQQPLTISRAVWAALREQVLLPGVRGQVPPPDGVTGEQLAQLADAWAPERITGEGDAVTVWLDADLAGVLAAVLDAHPAVAALLGS